MFTVISFFLRFQKTERTKEMIVTSDLTGKQYDDNEVFYFRNPKQCAFYISKYAIPVDIYTDRSMQLVFAFKKEDHFRLRDEWNNRPH